MGHMAVMKTLHGLQEEDEVWARNKSYDKQYENNCSLCVAYTEKKESH